VVAHDYTALAVFDHRQQAFDMWAIEFAGKGLMKEHMSVPLSGSPAGTAFAAGKPVCFRRADLEGLSADVASLLLAEDPAMCVVPLTVHDRRPGPSAGRLGTEPFSPGCRAARDRRQASRLVVENALAFQETAALKDRLAAEKVHLEDDPHQLQLRRRSSATRRRQNARPASGTVAPTDSAVLILADGDRQRR
jgi:formate hydrogenlyase transcriptional activator